MWPSPSPWDSSSRRSSAGACAPVSSQWQVGLGAAASHAILVSLTLLGVVALLDRPIWRTILGGAGILALGYLGVDALRASTVPPAADDAARAGLPALSAVAQAGATHAAQAGHPFLVGFSIGIANPIASVVFFGFSVRLFWKLAQTFR